MLFEGRVKLEYLSNSISIHYLSEMILVACKILRVIHTILKTGTTYDPQKQLKDIKRPVEAQAPMAA